MGRRNQKARVHSKRNHTGFLRRLNRYEVRRLSIARRAGYKLVSVHQFRKDQVKPEEIEIVLDSPNPYIEVCYSEWESPSSFATHYVNYSGKASGYDVIRAKNIRKELLMAGTSKRGKIYQLYYYSRDDDRSKNEKENLFAQGRAFFYEVKRMPYYFQLAGARIGDATLGKPGGLWNENQRTGSQLRADKYQRIINLKNRPRQNSDSYYELKYGGRLSYKTGYQILKNYHQLIYGKRNTKISEYQ